MSADAGFYLTLAVSGKQVGSDDPVYLKDKGTLVVVVGGSLVGESTENSPPH